MKKIGIVCLTLVLALGSLGIGYAMWAETIDVSATVNTGVLDVQFTAGSWDETPEVDGKEVGSGEVDTVFPSDAMSLILEKAYPCYGGDVVFTVGHESNECQNIPAHVTNVYFHAKGDGKYGTAIDADGNFVGATTPFVACDLVDLPECTTLYFDLDNDCDADISLHLKTGLICVQFDPPDGTVNGKVNIHVEQGADGCDTYTFDIVVKAVQWNEA